MRIALALCCLLLLTACEHLSQRQSPSLERQRAQIAKFKHWEVEGKISLRYQDERNTALFKWQHKGQDYSIYLSGPFGQGATWLRKHGQQVELENAKTGIRNADSPEALMQDLIGWQVPLSNLQYWIRGVAAPGLSTQEQVIDENGWLILLEQEGWRISYSKPIAANGWTLPGKILAERGDIRIIVIPKSWKTPKGIQPRAN